MNRLTASKAHRMGQQTAQYGLGPDANPFLPGHKYHSAWLDGWHNPDVQTVTLDSGSHADFYNEGEM